VYKQQENKNKGERGKGKIERENQKKKERVTWRRAPKKEERGEAAEKKGPRSLLKTRVRSQRNERRKEKHAYGRKEERP